MKQSCRFCIYRWIDGDNCTLPDGEVLETINYDFMNKCTHYYSVLDYLVFQSEYTTVVLSRNIVKVLIDTIKELDNDTIEE